MSASTKIGLPPRPFLYTVDQIAMLTNLSEQALHTQHLFHENRDDGIRKRHQMLARNVAPPDQRPDWRVAETELIRWFKVKGFKYYDRGTVTA
jgi:hypothetical protein